MNLRASMGHLISFLPQQAPRIASFANFLSVFIITTLMHCYAYLIQISCIRRLVRIWPACLVLDWVRFRRCSFLVVWSWVCHGGAVNVVLDECWTHRERTPWESIGFLLKQPLVHTRVWE